MPARSMSPATYLDCERKKPAESAPNLNPKKETDSDPTSLTAKPVWTLADDGIDEQDRCRSCDCEDHIVHVRK